ncbi:MAG: chromate resistance protein ChrB domain-containing protein [Nitrospirota bacterium]
MLHKNIKDLEWLLFFYSAPAKPVKNRMKIWRRLSRAGALHLKGAVYILPYNDENYELCQWLASEIASMGGAGDFVKVEKIETIKNKEIIELFNQQRMQDYSNIKKGLEELERKINSIKKGGIRDDDKGLREQLKKYSKGFEEIHKIDFFSSKTGIDLKKKVKAAEVEVKKFTGFKPKKAELPLPVKNVKDYQGRVWVTRKRPFVDRMSSAWLIKGFIDKKAVFRFIDEDEVGKIEMGAAAFDIKGGEFTHIGDMCTFEVLVNAFNLKDKALKKIAEIVHEIDIKDGKYENSDERGIEDILVGIRKTIKNDLEALEKGMTVFEMLYASKT